MSESSEEKSVVPKQKEWTNMVFGESWAGTLKICTIRYDFKPPSLDLSNAIVEHGTNNSVTIKVPDADNSGNCTVVYTGHSYKPKKEGMISVNHETGEAVLEKIDSMLRVKYTRPHNIPTASEAPASGDRRKAPSDTKRPPSTATSAPKQPSSAGTAASVSASKVATPSSTSGGKTKQSVTTTQLDELQKQVRVVLLSDKEDSDEEDRAVVSSSSISSSSSSSSDGETSSSSDDDEGKVAAKVNSSDSKQDNILTGPSPDCSSGKPQLSSCSSSSDLEGMNLDESSSNFCVGSLPDRSTNNPSRSSSSVNNNNNSGSFSSIPKGRYTSNLSDSDSEA